MKTMNFKHFNIIVVIAFCLFVFGTMGVAFAEDPPPEEGGEIVEVDDPEESTFQNPTQVQRAINLAEAYAEKPDPDLEKALDSVNETQDELDKTQSELDALDPDDPENEDAIADLKDKIAGLESDLKTAQDDVDTRMADNAGVTPESIEAMREDGMGWGQIAHELGLHPGLLGMGHTKRNNLGWGKGFNPDGKVSDSEIDEATARNFKSGFSKGHGLSADKGNKKDKGNSSGKGDTGNKGKGNSGNKGNSGGKKK